VSTIAAQDRKIAALTTSVDAREEARTQLSKEVQAAEDKRLRELHAERKTQVAMAKNDVGAAANVVREMQDTKVEACRAFVDASRELLAAEATFRDEARKLDQLTRTTETVTIERTSEHRPAIIDDNGNTLKPASTKSRHLRPAAEVTRRPRNPLIPYIPSLKARAAESTNEGWKLRELFNELREYARGF
jgi:hypothetical protein